MLVVGFGMCFQLYVCTSLHKIGFFSGTGQAVSKNKSIIIQKELKIDGVDYDEAERLAE